jgi:hypothetical protein
MIGKMEEKKGQCYLFDGNGNIKGVLHFNCQYLSAIQSNDNSGNQSR